MMAKTGSFDLNFPGAKLICDTPQKRASLLNYLNGQAQSIDVPLSYSNFEQDVDHALYNTTYIHESRHFHDHLLCPLLLHNYTLKILALYNLILATYTWIKGKQPYKYIPIPFCDWLELSEKEKLELIEKKRISTSDVPVYSLEEARALIENFRREYNSVRPHSSLGYTAPLSFISSFESLNTSFQLVQSLGA